MVYVLCELDNKNISTQSQRLYVTEQKTKRNMETVEWFK